jgi:hypothetical protein
MDFPMMMNNTRVQLRDLKLAGMASAVEEQLSSAASTGLSFEERLALMVDREVHHRDDKRRAALMKRAGLKYPQACIEDVDSKSGRGFERNSLMSLALSRWVEDGRRSWSPGRRVRASPGWPARWRSTPVGAGTRRCTRGCRAWPRTCACCMATQAAGPDSK